MGSANHRKPFFEAKGLRPAQRKRHVFLVVLWFLFLLCRKIVEKIPVPSGNQRIWTREELCGVAPTYNQKYPVSLSVLTGIASLHFRWQRQDKSVSWGARFKGYLLTNSITDRQEMVSGHVIVNCEILLY